MKLSNETLYRLCNKYQWFTGGDCRQYEKLFERNKRGASLETLAIIIWLCSSGYDKDTNPEGESLRGSLIYTTKIFVDNDIFKGMNKKILEPAFKETQKMPVLIEIRG